VLAAASELLNEVGFEAVTIELVSERSGVARSTLYRHWRTKGQMLRDAWAEQHAPAASTPDSDGGRGRLASYAAAVAEGMQATWGRSAATLAVSAFDDPDQLEMLRAFTEGTRGDLRRIVGMAVAETTANALERLVDDVEAAVIAPLFYCYVFRQQPLSPEDARRLAERAWDVVVEPSGAPVR
jgi:AcrR family transcriptional regulator